MRALKAFFLGRLLREKLLLVVFVALAALIWLSNFGRRANRFWQTQRSTSNELADQTQWLANRQAIENEAVLAVKNLDPVRTLDDTRNIAARAMTDNPDPAFRRWTMEAAVLEHNPEIRREELRDRAAMAAHA